MAVPYYGDFAEDDTVHIPFNTFSSDDPSASVTATTLIDSDIYVHKDGAVTPITTDGATIDIDINAIAGSHMIAIDTSVDAAYATGSEYAVRIEGATVDGALINAWVGAFSIERAGGALARLETLITTVGAAGVGLTDVNTKTITAGAIANASFNADVGSTAHGTNIIALACRKILEELNLDHLLKVDTTVAADGDLEAYVVAGTVMGHLLSTSADATLYKASTDSMQAIRDRGDAAWVTGGGTGLTALASGTAQAGAAGTIQLAAAHGFADNELNGNVVNIHTGTGAGQSRVITDYTGATDTATVTPNWTTSPDATSQYEIVQGSTNTTAVSLTAQTANDNSADINAILVGTVTNAQGADVATDVAAAIGTDSKCLISTDAQDLSATLDVNTKTITANAITATAINADAITEAKIADNAIAAEHIAAGAIDIATFAADVGSTAYASNPVAKAAKLGVDEYDPPTKAELDTAQGAVTVAAIDNNAITAASINADAITEAKIADNAIAAEHLNATACTKIIDDFETQSQADPTGFHVNTMEVESTAAKSAINTEMADVINTDTIAEHGVGVPAATPSLSEAVMWLYMDWRNLTQTTADEHRVSNDAGTIIAEANISDDATTFSKGEWGAVD